MAQSGCEVLFSGVGGEEWVRGWCRQGDGCYQIKFAGAVRNIQINELRDTGMSRLRGVADMCSRMVSDTAYR